MILLSIITNRSPSSPALLGSSELLGWAIAETWRPPALTESFEFVLTVGGAVYAGERISIIDSLPTRAVIFTAGKDHSRWRRTSEFLKAFGLSM